MAALSALLTDNDYGLFGQEAIGVQEFDDAVDAYPSETHSISYSKTDYPTETGGSHTDNITKLPDKLVLEGFVSNLGNPAGIAQVPGSGRPKAAWERIREVARREDIVSVVTTLGLYENMLITGFDATVNVDTGQTLSFTMTLEEAEFSNTQVTTLPAAQLGDPAGNKSGVVDAGTKQAAVLEGQRPSVLLQAVEGLGSLF